MEDNWIYIDDFDFSKEPNYIFCDTRDFHCIGVDSIGEAIKVPYKDNKYTIQEIKDFLKKLEKESGGKGEWRCISWPHIPTWWKYMRFKKYDGYYLGYCDAGKIQPLDKGYCNPEKIERKYINFCKED